MSNNQLATILSDARKVSVREYKNSTATRYTTGGGKLTAWAKARGLNPNDEETRKEHSRFCNRENSKGAQALSHLTQDGMVIDAMIDKVDNDGVRQAFTIKLVRPSVPKIKTKSEKITAVYSDLSDEDRADVLAYAKAKADKAKAVIEV